MNKRTSVRNEIIVYLFIAIVCLSLIIYLLNSSKKYSCNQCSVEFKSRLPITNFEKTLVVNITDLYNYYSNNQCLVQWDENQGYYKNG